MISQIVMSIADEETRRGKRLGDGHVWWRCPVCRCAMGLIAVGLVVGVVLAALTLR